MSRLRLGLRYFAAFVVVVAAMLLALVWILSLGGCACSKIGHPQAQFAFHATEGTVTLHSHDNTSANTTLRSHDRTLHSYDPTPTTPTTAAPNNTTRHSHDTTFWRNSTAEHRRVHHGNGTTRNDTALGNNTTTLHRHVVTHRLRITHDGGDWISPANLTIWANVPFRTPSNSAEPVERATWHALGGDTETVERTHETNSRRDEAAVLSAGDSVVIELVTEDAALADVTVRVIWTNTEDSTAVLGVWTGQDARSSAGPDGRAPP